MSKTEPQKTNIPTTAQVVNEMRQRLVGFGISLDKLPFMRPHVIAYEQERANEDAKRRLITYSEIAGYPIENFDEWDKYLCGCPREVVKNPDIPPHVARVGMMGRFRENLEKNTIIDPKLLGEFLDVTITQDDPPHPGAVLRQFYLDPVDITVTELAKHIGVGRSGLSHIVNGRAPILPAMALRLAAALDTTPELWLNMQQAYDLYAARKVFTETIDPL